MTDEPIYEYVKGQGWVTNYSRPFPNSDNFNLLCRNCGKRAGLHRVTIHLCPADDWNSFLESKWA